MKVVIVFHSMWSHVYKMAQAVVEGAWSAGTEVRLLRVPEMLSAEALEKMGATESKKIMEKVPIATNDCLVWADAIIFGTGTRFGMMTAQMRAFLDHTGGL